MSELLETLPAARPTLATAPPPRLSWRAQLGLTHLAFAHNFQWTALLIITIPAQVVTIAGEKNKTTALAGVLVAGALIAAVTQIVGGGLSDRATFRLGRRRPFIVSGALVGLVGLYLMGRAHSLPLLAAAYLLLQLGFSFGQSAYAAVIPDRVPAAQRGGASGLIGLMALLGAIAAAVVAGKIVKEGSYASFSALYLIVMGVQALFTATTVLALREEPLEAGEPLIWDAFLGDLARSLWQSLRAYPDFAWVFVTRFLVMMGYWTVLNFLFFYVRDQLGRGNAAPVVSLITGTVIVAAAITIFFGGYISDRVGRKPVVYASAGLMALVSLTFIVTHTVVMAVVVGAVWGLGWGAFLGVDWALATDVLPRPTGVGEATSYARFMGIWALAISLPEVVSPAIGPVIQVLNQHAKGSGYTFMFVAVFVYFLLGAVLVRNVRVTR